MKRMICAAGLLGILFFVTGCGKQSSLPATDEPSDRAPAGDTVAEDAADAPAADPTIKEPASQEPPAPPAAEVPPEAGALDRPADAEDGKTAKRKGKRGILGAMGTALRNAVGGPADEEKLSKPPSFR